MSDDKKAQELEFKVRTFFEDPSNAEEADFLRLAIKRVVTEMEEERKKQQPEKRSFLDELFGKVGGRDE